MSAAGDLASAARPELCSYCYSPLGPVPGVCRVAIRTACGDLLHVRCWLESTTVAPPPPKSPEPVARVAKRQTGTRKDSTMTPATGTPKEVGS